MDFGVGQGAKRSADIRSDLGPASNAGKRQNQRNRHRREAEGQLAASLGRYSPLWRCASLAPCHRPFCLYARPIPVFQQSPEANGRSKLRHLGLLANHGGAEKVQHLLDRVGDRINAASGVEQSDRVRVGSNIFNH